MIAGMLKKKNSKKKYIFEKYSLLVVYATITVYNLFLDKHSTNLDVNPLWQNKQLISDVPIIRRVLLKAIDQSPANQNLKSCDFLCFLTTNFMSLT